MFDSRDFILDELAINKLYYIELVKPYTEERDNLLEVENSLFDKYIMQDYRNIVIEVIMEDMVQRFPLNAEDILVVLQDVDLLNFLEPVN